MNAVRNVFLDTEAFVRAGLNFDGTSLGRLRELARLGHVRLYVSEVVRQEVRRQLSEKASELTKHVRSATESTRVLGRRQGEVVRLLEEVSSEGAQERFVEGFETFVHDAEVAVLPIDGVSAGTLCKWYFAGTAPFGSGTKKAEFPDAISLLALLDHASKFDARFDVVSGDRDHERFCALHEALTSFDTINALVDELERTRVAKADALSAYLRSDDAALRASVRDALTRIELEFDDPEVLDAEVELLDLVAVEGTIVEVLDAEDDPALVAVSARVTFDAEVRGEDVSRAVWDKEDGRHIGSIAFEDRYRVEVDQEFTLEVSSELTDPSPQFRIASSMLEPANSVLSFGRRDVLKTLKSRFET